MRAAVARGVATVPSFLLPVRRNAGVGAPAGQTLNVAVSLTPYTTTPAPAGSGLTVFGPPTATVLNGQIGGGGAITSGPGMSPVFVALDGTPGTLTVSWQQGAGMVSAVIDIVGSGAPATPVPLHFLPPPFPFHQAPAPAPSNSIMLTGGHQYTLTITSPVALMTPSQTLVQGQLPGNYTIVSLSIDSTQTIVTLVLTVAQDATEPWSTFLNAVGAPSATITYTDTTPVPLPAPAPTGTVPVVPGDNETITITSPVAIAITPTLSAVQESLNASGSTQTYNVASVTLDPTRMIMTLVVDIFPLPYSIGQNFSPVEQVSTFVNAVGAPVVSTATIVDNGASATVPLTTATIYTVQVNETPVPNVAPAVQGLDPSYLPTIAVLNSTGVSFSVTPTYKNGSVVQENPLVFAMAVGAPGGSTVTITPASVPAPTPTPPPGPSGGSVILTGGYNYVVMVTEPTLVTSIPTQAAVQVALPAGPPNNPDLYTVTGVSGHGSAVQILLSVSMTVSEQLATFVNAVGAPAGSTVTAVSLGPTPVVVTSPTVPQVPIVSPQAPPVVPVVPVVKGTGPVATPAATTSTTTTVLVAAGGIAVVGGALWWASRAGWL